MCFINCSIKMKGVNVLTMLKKNLMKKQGCDERIRSNIQFRSGTETYHMVSALKWPFNKLTITSVLRKQKLLFIWKLMIIQFFHNWQPNVFQMCKKILQILFVICRAVLEGVRQVRPHTVSYLDTKYFPLIKKEKL